MSELALIPPYSYLGDLRDRRLHMFLPTCLKSHYAQEYEKVAAQGWHVVLDNGMFEENKPYPNTHLLYLAAKYGCNEIVMPDVRNSPIGTLEAIERFLHTYWGLLRYPESGVQDDSLIKLRFMAVVQGQNIKEQLELVKALEDVLPKGSLLGFPRRLTEERTSARLEIMEEVVSTYGTKYPLHMLGLSREWPGEYLRATQQFGSHLRGLDTSAPYCFAFNQSTIQTQWSSGGERPHNYFLQRADRFDNRLVRYNTYVLSCWNQGVTPVTLKTWRYENGM